MISLTTVEQSVSRQRNIKDLVIAQPESIHTSPLNELISRDVDWPVLNRYVRESLKFRNDTYIDSVSTAAKLATISNITGYPLRFELPDFDAVMSSELDLVIEQDKVTDKTAQLIKLFAAMRQLYGAKAATIDYEKYNYIYRVTLRECELYQADTGFAKISAQVLADFCCAFPELNPRHNLVYENYILRLKNAIMLSTPADKLGLMRALRILRPKEVVADSDFFQSTFDRANQTLRGNWDDFIEAAENLAVVMAKKVNLTDNGLQLVFDPSTSTREVQASPTLPPRKVLP